MPESDKQVGEIQNPRDQICIQWEIKNYFSSIPQKADTYVTSQVFHFASASWFLKLYPNGTRNDNTVEWIHLYLCINDSITEEKMINFTFSIKSLEFFSNWRIEGFSNIVFNSKHKIWGYNRFLRRNELLRKKHNLVPGGSLTVVCTARLVTGNSVKEVASQTTDGVSTLSEDLQNLFAKGKNFDFTIIVKGVRFRVHKSILGTRSPVFSAMFEHGMKENITDTVDVNDCEPHIFLKFLLFLYSGKIENLSSENVEGLYYLADKYILKDLTSICLNFMKENLDLSNVLGVLAIADRHHEEELRKSATEMIKRNLKTLIPYNQWITFLAKNPVLASKLLMEVLPDSKS